MTDPAKPIPDQPVSLDYEVLREQITKVGLQLQTCNLPNITEMKSKLEEIASRKAEVEKKLREATEVLDSKIQELKEKNGEVDSS
jgi:hypothetical protein